MRSGNGSRNIRKPRGKAMERAKRVPPNQRTQAIRNETNGSIVKAKKSAFARCVPALETMKKAARTPMPGSAARIVRGSVRSLEGAGRQALACQIKYPEM